MKKLFWIFLTVFALVIAGCGGAGGGKSVFTDAAEMPRIMAELQNRSELKGKELMVFQDVNVVNGKDYGGNFILINLLKPGTTEDVDRYEYRNGSWGGPSPVKITGSGDMKDNLTPWSEFAFDKVADMYKTVETKAKETGDANLKVEQSMIYRFWQGEMSIMMNAKSDRSEYRAEFDMQGNLQSFKKK